MVDKALISQRTLKYIAYISMVMDHLGIMLNRHELISGEVYAIMRGVGRLAFPLFLFLLVQGAVYTKSTPKYLGRMALFAIISEVPYDLFSRNEFFSLRRQNIYFELLACLILIVLLNRFLPCNGLGCGFQGRGLAPRDGGDSSQELSQDVDFCPAYIVFFTVVMCIPAYFLHFLYGYKGVVATAFMYKFVQERNLFEKTDKGSNRLFTKHQIMGILYLCLACGALLFRSSKVQIVAFLVVPLIFFSSNQYTKQSKGMQLFFYLIYPLHLIILFLIGKVI